MLAPAKLNLYLHVTGKRADGYHLLDTLIVFTDIQDEIEIKPASQFSLEIIGEFASLVENDEHNIITRAYRLMQQECGRQDNVAIKLIKNIPVGAGLGGGSSDAATTLMLLNDLWQAGFSKQKLSAIGLKLGADVPIFINRHAAFVSGIGEKITNTNDLPELYALMVYPNKHISTKEVFSKLRHPELVSGSIAKNNDSLSCEKKLKDLQIKSQDYSSDTSILKQVQDDQDWLPFLKNQKNDLTNPAIYLFPEISTIINNLEKLEGCQFARMSGSGSTCFAVFSDKNMVEEGLLNTHKSYPSYWIVLCKLVTIY